MKKTLEFEIPANIPSKWHPFAWRGPLHASILRVSAFSPFRSAYPQVYRTSTDGWAYAIERGGNPHGSVYESAHAAIQACEEEMAAMGCYPEIDPDCSAGNEDQLTRMGEMWQSDF